MEFSTKIPEIMDRRRLNWVICIKFTWAVILKIFVTLFIEGNVLIARAHKSFRFIVKFNKNIFFGPNGLLNMKLLSNLSCLQMFNECVVMITRKN